MTVQSDPSDSGSIATNDRAVLTVRSRAPVFVVGSPRSGTTLLYHMLLSAGRFAIYRAETHVFNVLVPRFGDPGVPSNRAAERIPDA